LLDLLVLLIRKGVVRVNLVPMKALNDAQGIFVAFAGDHCVESVGKSLAAHRPAADEY
jgi:hypothetical protein